MSKWEMLAFPLSCKFNCYCHKVVTRVQWIIFTPGSRKFQWIGNILLFEFLMASRLAYHIDIFPETLQLFILHLWWNVSVSASILPENWNTTINHTTLGLFDCPRNFRQTTRILLSLKDVIVRCNLIGEETCQLPRNSGTSFAAWIETTQS